MTGEEDYKIVTGSDSHCQKVLNQWKHQYELDILHMFPNNVPDKEHPNFTINGLTMLVKRTKE